MKKWDLVEIFWEDSYQMHGWVHLDDAEVDEDVSLGHQSVGYFIGETPKQITICQSKKSSKELDDAPETNVNAVFSIPKRAIISKRLIKTPTNKHSEAK
jgi:hypothetical protein